MEIPTIFQRLSYFLHSFLLFLIPKHLTHSPPTTTTTTTTTHSHQSNLRRPPQLNLRQVFDTFDENKDGLITKTELSNSLHNMGLAIPDPDLTRLIERVDSNGDDCVDVAEFESLYRQMAVEEECEEGGSCTEEVFAVFDKDGDGFISEEELKSVLEKLGLGGHGRSLEEYRRMIDKVDVDGDGRVSLMEFELMMKNVPAFGLVAS